MAEQHYNQDISVGWDAHTFYEHRPMIFVNNMLGTIAADIGAADDRIQLSLTASPSNYDIGSLEVTSETAPFCITVMDNVNTMTRIEIIEVYDKQGSEWLVNRAAEGTIAQAWTTGSPVRQYVTAGMLAHLQRLVRNAFRNTELLRQLLDADLEEMAILQAQQIDDSATIVGLENRLKALEDAESSAGGYAAGSLVTSLVNNQSTLASDVTGLADRIAALEADAQVILT